MAGYHTSPQPTGGTPVLNPNRATDQFSQREQRPTGHASETERMESHLSPPSEGEERTTQPQLSSVPPRVGVRSAGTPVLSRATVDILTSGEALPAVHSPAPGSVHKAAAGFLKGPLEMKDMRVNEEALQCPGAPRRPSSSVAGLSDGTGANVCRDFTQGSRDASD